jgi:hypothetical protein
MLKLVSENWLDDRVQASMGDNGQWEFKLLRGETLKMDRVKVIARIVPLDPVKQQSLNQAIVAGAFNPQLPPQVRRKVLELYQLSPDLDDSSRGAKVQTKEIEQGKSTGQFPPPVAFKDDDMAHINTLRSWMNSDEWDPQPPPVKQGAYQHLLGHMQNLQTVAAAQGAIQGASSEAGGQPQQGGQEQQSPGQRQAAGQQRGAQMKPHKPQPTAGNQHHVGSDVGQSHSAQQRRRNRR